MPKTLKLKIKHREYGTENTGTVLYRQHIRFYGSTMHMIATKQTALLAHQTEQSYSKGMLFLMRPNIGCQRGICKENERC